MQGGQREQVLSPSRVRFPEAPCSQSQAPVREMAGSTHQLGPHPQGWIILSVHCGGLSRVPTPKSPGITNIPRGGKSVLGENH